MRKCTQVQPGHLSVPSLNGQMQNGHHLCHDVKIVDAQLLTDSMSKSGVLAIS